MTTLARTIGVADAAMIGCAAMLGAGVFVVFAPATAEAGGPGMLIALAVAAFIAFCNATSSARLAARYPESGGTYVYGRERIGDFAGFLAGWGFVIGKTASCAAMALTLGSYLIPEYERLVGIAAVIVLTTVNLLGVDKTAAVSRVLVTLTLGVLILVIAVGADGVPDDAELGTLAGASPYEVLTAAGMIFFAFAGYARIATLGEEVRDPRRTIPLAIPLALGVVVAVYAAVAITALAVLGPDELAAASAPMVDVLEAAGAPALVPLLRIGAGLAVAGVLLSLLAGVGRTGLAMARRGDLPGPLAKVHPRGRVPHIAEVAAAVAVVGLVAFSDLRGAIGFSSFAVLLYYAIANASAITLGRDRDRRLPVQTLAVLGLAGCLAVAFCLPWRSVVTGVAMFAIGAVWYFARRSLRGASPAPGVADPS